MYRQLRDPQNCFIWAGRGFYQTIRTVGCLELKCATLAKYFSPFSEERAFHPSA